MIDRTGFLKCIAPAFILMWSLIAPGIVQAVNEYKWGGPGWDSALKDSALFAARSRQGDPQTIEILVDSRAANKNGVQEIRLVMDEDSVVVSGNCRKTMRHVTAPIGCPFNRSDIARLSGAGRIVVIGKNQQVLHQAEVDFNRLNTIPSPE